MISIRRFMLVLYAIREMLLTSFNQAITTINANNVAKRTFRSVSEAFAGVRNLTAVAA